MAFKVFFLLAVVLAISCAYTLPDEDIDIIPEHRWKRSPEDPPKEGEIFKLKAQLEQDGKRGPLARAKIESPIHSWQGKHGQHTLEAYGQYERSLDHRAWKEDKSAGLQYKYTF
ncbi:hypothetical protein ACFFRR_011383 [Megaselia abdita]